jgi:hypothetical protein
MNHTLILLSQFQKPLSENLITFLAQQQFFLMPLCSTHR